MPGGKKRCDEGGKCVRTNFDFLLLPLLCALHLGLASTCNRGNERNEWPLEAGGETG